MLDDAFDLELSDSGIRIWPVSSLLKAIRTRAVRDGDDYVISGQKVYISNGQQCDLLVVACKTDPNAGEWGRSATSDLIRSRIKVKALSFMRGRTFQSKFLIIDEAQNLTPKQMKTLITRAGPGTKVVCMGNIAQIDTPYLTEGSSGITYVVDRFKGWAHSGHITLQRGERSRLADFATEAL